MFLYAKEVELFAREMGIDISEETNEVVTEKSEENEQEN